MPSRRASRSSARGALQRACVRAQLLVLGAQRRRPRARLLLRLAVRSRPSVRSGPDVEVEHEREDDRAAPSGPGGPSGCGVRHGPCRCAFVRRAAAPSSATDSQLSAEHRAARELGVAAERLLDAQQLVVLRHAIRARRRAGLDLAAAGGDGEVGDRRVLGLARAVRHDRGVAGRRAPCRSPSSVSVSVPIWLTLMRIELADAGVDAALQALGVGDEQVVADELDLVAERARSAPSSRPSPPRPCRPRSRRSGSGAARSAQ